MGECESEAQRAAAGSVLRSSSKIMSEQKSNKPERRDFLKLAGAATITGFPAIISAQTVTNAIKVGLVGCGGGGTGAASPALKTHDYLGLLALPGIDPGQIDRTLPTLKKMQKIADPVHVEQ